jgi:alkylhydroperoxidase/carboxymuconolactone decarboxylase family protein YurZ
MMDSETILPSGRLRKANERVGDAFKTFRDLARDAGPLDRGTIEFIMIAGFATAGHQEPFKNHVRRALQAGVAKEALQQVVMATLGATSVLPAVANALRWIDEVEAEPAAE